MSGAGATHPCCGTCRHFNDRAEGLETALPGLAILSSANASVACEDGLCARHNRFCRATDHCPAFAHVGEHFRADHGSGSGAPHQPIG